jgi:hypothetical protein
MSTEQLTCPLLLTPGMPESAARCRREHCAWWSVPMDAGGAEMMPGACVVAWLPTIVSVMAGGLRPPEPVVTMGSGGEA